MVFKCSGCGECCKNFRKKEVQIDFEEGIIIPMADKDEMTIPLWDWEANKIDDSRIKPLAIR